jgi:hypothetical protein
VLLRRQELAQGNGESVTGTIRDLGLVDALQGLLGARRSAVVDCEAYGRTARVWVKDGQVIDAELGALEGEPAFWRLMTWESGAWRIDPREVDRERRIDGGTEAALVEAMRRVEEMEKVGRELAMTTVLSLDFDQLAERLAELPDEVNGVVRNFDGKRTLREAVDLSPVDDLSTIEVVRRMMAHGILRVQDARKTAIAGGKPTLQQWLTSKPPPEQDAERPLPSLDAARAAAALVEEMAAAEQAELERDRLAEEHAVTAVARTPPAPVGLLHFPPMRGVRRERLRREAEEARAKVAAAEPVRLTRVVELPPWKQDGSDAIDGGRRMSPAVGEAAKRFAPDAPVSRLNSEAPPPQDAEVLLASMSGPAEPKTEPPEPVSTPKIAPAVPDTPPPAATPPLAAIMPGTPPPDRGLEAEMLRSLPPPKRRWWAWAAAGAIALLAAWFLRPVRTDKKDAPWLGAEPAKPVAVEPAAPPAPEPQKPVEPAKPAAAPPAAPPTTPASDQLYAKALEQGEASLRAGKYKAAVAHFRRAAQEKPQSVPALLALGDAYLEADKPGSAVRPLEQAARLDPKSGRAQLLLGTAWQSLGKNAQATKAYGRYLELDPQGEYAKDVRLILANLSR